MSITFLPGTSDQQSAQTMHCSIKAAPEGKGWPEATQVPVAHRTSSTEAFICFNEGALLNC